MLLGALYNLVLYDWLFLGGQQAMKSAGGPSSIWPSFVRRLVRGLVGIRCQGGARRGSTSAATTRAGAGNAEASLPQYAAQAPSACLGACFRRLWAADLRGLNVNVGSMIMVYDNILIINNKIIRYIQACNASGGGLELHNHGGRCTLLCKLPTWATLCSPGPC